MQVNNFKFTLSKQLRLEYFFSDVNNVQQAQNKDKIFSWQSSVLGCPLVNFKTPTLISNFYISIH